MLGLGHYSGLGTRLETFKTCTSLTLDKKADSEATSFPCHLKCCLKIYTTEGLIMFAAGGW